VWSTFDADKARARLALTVGEDERLVATPLGEGGGGGGAAAPAAAAVLDAPPTCVRATPVADEPDAWPALGVFAGCPQLWRVERAAAHEDGSVSDVQRAVPAALFRKDVRLVFYR